MCCHNGKSKYMSITQQFKDNASVFSQGFGQEAFDLTAGSPHSPPASTGYHLVLEFS